MSTRKMCKVTPKRSTKTSLSKIPIFDNLSSSTSSDEEPTRKQGFPSEKKESFNSETPAAEVSTCRNENTIGESLMETDFTCEMSKMLNMFGTDMSKALLAKNKRLEQFTEATVQVSNCRVSEMCKRQASERAAQLEEARNAMCTALDQWEHDIKRSEEQEEKIIKMAQQQVKMLQQTRLSHTEQVIKLRQLCSGIPKLQRAEEVESQHRRECDKMQAELKTELTGLQKKIMLETQKEELANMQKTLQSAWLM